MITQIKTEHIAIPEWHKEMELPASISELLFKQQGDQLLVERLITKGLVWSDFSPTENLIELEDTSTGDLFWEDTKDLFRIPCPANYPLGFELNKIFNIRARAYDQVGAQFTEGSYQVHYTFQVELVEFKSRVYRNRTYLQALFNRIPNTLRAEYRTKQTSQSN